MTRLADELAERRFERLVAQLTTELQVRRSLTLAANSVENIEEWRKAAQAAGRRLHIPVRTGVSRDGTKIWASEGP